jgi:hypothetical protein
MSTMWLHLSREKGKRPLDLFSSGFFLLEEYIKNSENDVDQREQSCQRQSACTSVLEVSITGVQAVRCLLVLAKKQFRECGKTNAYSANIEFNVSAHGEHIRERKAPTENSNRCLKEWWYQSSPQLHTWHVREGMYHGCDFVCTNKIITFSGESIPTNENCSIQFPI